MACVVRVVPASVLPPGSPSIEYSVNAMNWGTVELEPEVRDWLERLPTAQFATAAF
ncbi:hypothetical protein FF36_02046 [Frankia torreyi]|uniref:Uncharacterized protein n=1 Tax=Frankia torreyi TaxID=1856 RepID=A0A0D8BJK5_9ACTN|nr:hypothetical protein FF36_02046 [Frankia torreyi]KQM05902.1 hypothetical protein FF86_101270 [Frankia sp. CpI1-P]